MDRKRSRNSIPAKVLCALALVGLLCAAALPAFAEGLKIGTEVRVVALGGFEVTGQTEDFTLPEGGSQELKISTTQPAQSWLWERSTDGGTTWQAVGTDETYSITNAALNRNAAGEDIPYQYRVTATNTVGETATTVIRVLVSDEYAYRTLYLRSEDVDISAYMHDQTRLVVTPLEEDETAVVQLLEAQLAEGCLPRILCDVSLVNDRNDVVPYFGALELEFEVGTQYNGQTLRAFHYYNGAVETYSGTVANGKLTIVVHALSPFMVEVPDSTAHIVTAVSGTGGSILPEGKVTVADGADKHFTFLPEAGHCIRQVLVDGQPVPFEGNSYTLRGVRADCTVEARFAPVDQEEDEHVLLITTGPHGYVTPGTVTIPHGEDVTLFFYPDPGYEVDRVLINDEESDPVEYTVFGICYTIPAMTEDLTVDVTFRKAEVVLPLVCNTVTAESGPGGSISPAGQTKVPYGGALYYYFIPDAGYTLDKVYLDGVETAVAGNVYRMLNIVKPHTLRATFKPAESPAAPVVYHTVTTENGSFQVPDGGSQFFYFTAAAGKTVTALFRDGQPLPAAGRGIQLQNIKADTTFTVVYSDVSDTWQPARSVFPVWYAAVALALLLALALVVGVVKRKRKPLRHA